MMWNRAALRVVPPDRVPAALPEAPQILPPDQSEAVQSLLGRWLELSELERRAFAAMARELTATSSVVEHSAIDLSGRFQTLAELARAQAARVQAVTATACSIRVGTQEVAMSEATHFIEEVLVKVINTVLASRKMPCACSAIPSF
jgi:hypothetical protein